MEKIKTLTTLEEIKVFSDPYRLQILTCFKQFGEPATVKQIADEMGEVPAKVHYHVKKMEKVEILELIYTKEINGIIAKYYRPTAESFSIKNSNIESPMFEQFLNKTQTTVSNLYDESKRIFLEQLESTKADIPEEDIIRDSFVTSTPVYLTEEQYTATLKYIKDLSDKNTKKNSGNKEKFYLFTSLIKIEDNKK